MQLALGRSSSMLKWSALRSPESTRWPLSVVRDRELFGMAEQVQRKLAGRIEGAQPADLTATKLVRRIDLALDWTVQKRQLGFG